MKRVIIGLMMALGIVAFGANSTASASSAVTFIPTTTTDELNGICATSSQATFEQNGAGLSLREAICLANQTVGLDVIVLDNKTYTLSLDGGVYENDNHSGDLDIHQPLTIRSFYGATIKQTTAHRVLHLQLGAGGSTLHNLTITGGDSSTSGGGLFIDTIVDPVIISRTTITQNAADIDGAGISILNNSDVYITDSSISANITGFAGGGIYTQGSLEMYRSSIMSNTASRGGGISSVDAPSVFIADSTISSNVATDKGGGLYIRFNNYQLRNVSLVHNVGGNSGGAYEIDDIDGGTLDFKRSLIAGNIPANSQCDNSLGYIFDDYNLLQTGSGCDTSGALDVISSQAVSDIIAGFADNGGPTLTHDLVPGSDAINAIPCNTPDSLDQRSLQRPINGACDIGAVEYYRGSNTYIVNSTATWPDADPSDLICADINNLCTLRAAIEQANEFAGEDTIVLQKNETYTPSLDTFSLRHDLMINGRGSTIDGSLLSGSDVFEVTGSATVIFDGLSITGAADDAIEINDEATIYLLNSVLFGNNTGYQVLTSSGMSILNGVTIANNSSRAIAGAEDLLLDNSIVWGNGLTIDYDDQASVTVRSSNIQGNVPAGVTKNNITVVDPLFANATIGDFRLMPISPLLNAGNNALMTADFLDRDNDAITLEASPHDLAGQPRLQDGTVEPGALETTTTPLGDVPSDLPAPFMEDWVETFYYTGITRGKGQCEDGTTPGPGEVIYCPKDKVTRAEMAVFILRAMEYPNLPYDPPGDPTDPFADVFSGSPDLPAPFMEDWIEEFYAREITGGKGVCTATSPTAGPDDLTYCPKDEVTRAEMAVFILKALGVSPFNADPNPFVDVPSDLPAPFMEPWVETFLAKGITGGKPNCVETSPPKGPGDETFCPKDKVTRAEMAVFILRAFDTIPDPDDTP